MRHCPWLVNISRNCDEAVTNPGQIDLKSMLAIVDIIHGFVVGKVWRYAEESAKTST